MKFLAAHKGKVAFAVIVGIALVLLPWSIAPEVTLPATLGSLQLTGSHSGQYAREMMDRMHDKAVSPNENLIGKYSSPDGEATLYLSIYESASEAERDLRKMVELIRPGGPMLGEFELISVSGHEVASCLGLGQRHYFLSRGKVLYWLAADQTVANAAIIHLLESSPGPS